jgi:hypothetical protein
LEWREWFIAKAAEALHDFFLRWDCDSGTLWRDHNRVGWDLLFLHGDFFLWWDHDSGALRDSALLFLWRYRISFEL